MVWKTKVLLKVELPTGKLGLTVVKRPPTVGAVRTDSPVVGQVVPGDVILSLTLPGMGDVETKGKDGQAVMDTLVAFADREGRGLTVEKHGIYGVGVPPGPLGVLFLDGTCTVHAVKPRSPLRGVTKAGDTLLSVDGKPVTPATIFDVIKAADDPALRIIVANAAHLQMQEEWGHEVAAEALPAEGVAMAEVLGVEEGDNMKAPWTIVGEDGAPYR